MFPGTIVSVFLRVVKETIQGILLVLLLLCLCTGLGQNISHAHDVFTDQVSSTSGHGKLFGLTPGEGITRQVLGAGEQVLVIEAKGLTGFIQTTTCLLGCSGNL